MLSVSLSLIDVAGDVLSYALAGIGSLMPGFPPAPPLS
ncbi:hypothetical protein Cocul_02104 [Corynebacterium oculi]|uniref:Uncharacterized protein n=1 Tax=Corynebacterium oculi TaxID=1544416 RepID=A0A0Q0Z1R2_9CORY|nr:hypothetical protein Cocul_02104 [Corynebacterium oculi]